MINVRIIIAVYKNIPFLQKVLDSIEFQTYKNFDVAIVEDGDFPAMKAFIEATSYSFPIHHYTQEDLGFRKNRILNVALRAATQELLVFIDGDCVLHPKFIESYVKFYDPKVVLFAKRVDLDQKTSQLLLTSSLNNPSVLTMLKNKTKRIEDGIYLPFKPVKVTNGPTMLGCNMGIPLSALKTINGFDEDYENAGYGEDCDIEWRLQKAGFEFKNLKFHVIQYHLYHERPDREDETAISRGKFNAKKTIGKIACINGLDKLA
jgi:cellulose synthase/poly-beta-1,6-N-acetylglucosamine synthase-like glycosyltransferase